MLTAEIRAALHDSLGSGWEDLQDGMYCLVEDNRHWVVQVTAPDRALVHCVTVKYALSEIRKGGVSVQRQPHVQSGHTAPSDLGELVEEMRRASQQWRTNDTTTTK